MRDFKGAIFDLDGTLLDSMHVWETVVPDYLTGLGHRPLPGLREDIRDLSGVQVGRYLRRTYALKKSPREIFAGINDMLRDFYAHRAQLKDGVADTLAALRARSVSMCVATATERALMEPAMERTGIAPYFQRIFTCPEVGRGKDRPDIFLQALAALSTHQDETVVFEDALYAIRTAKKAGFKVAALFDPSAQGDREEIKRLADWYFESFAQFDAATFPAEPGS